MEYGWSDRVLVIGGGPAGMAASEELRRQGFTGNITLLCDEPDAPYDRPACSKSLLTGHARPQDVRMPIDGGLDVRWEHGRRAVEVDLRRRTVLTQTDEEYAFDGLVLATGSYATLPKGWPDGPGMHVLHSVDEAWQLRQDLRHAERVAIVGGGITGCEVACAVRELAREAVLIDPKPYVMGRAVGEPIGALIADEHDRFGVEMRLGRRVKEVERRRGGWRLSLDDGSYVNADIVVATLGEKPDTDFLSGTGIDISRGILCDESLRAVDVTGAHIDGVVAAGAAVRWPNLLYSGEPMMVGQWIAAVEMGHAAARTLLAGDREVPPVGIVPRYWTLQNGLRVMVAGDFKPTDHIVLTEMRPGRRDTARAGVMASYYRDDELVGLIAVNAARAFTETTRAMLIDTPVRVLPQPKSRPEETRTGSGRRLAAVS
ncbi:NAD(P)/FAD-dependent oxidoreductase [Planosporangium mesophilum]|uniref:Ferredoxin reductase n=1 Tax=Planosporangium mesophilum TaxID=689768 RepID=A0A8J3TLW7_9ACTN|nr:FAD/NAD(P)-binding oxidoreductase [Planosporangium mesophilum]NJC82800.1 oxidoreductase [Planosporangium mesophilum]GII23730.1 ferredoxin reductase [Planosporangium mesophilum]